MNIIGALAFKWVVIIGVTHALKKTLEQMEQNA